MHIGNHGYAPTYREISLATGLRSISSVQYQLDVLEARGFIVRYSKNSQHIARGIALVNRDSQ